MTRVADSTIKGFLYQFNKTMVEILDSDHDQEITIEGIIEDIDITAIDGTATAVQCKYHESVTNYSTSLIYKPLLQMAESYSKDQNKKTKYIIFIHVPTQTEATRNITPNEIDSALASQDSTYIKLINRIQQPIDKVLFSNSVQLQFGPSLDEIEKTAKRKLDELKITAAETECILYPNALNRIAKISSFSKETERKLTKLQFIRFLSGVSNTAVTKWTLALKNRKEILQTMRSQLQSTLNLNSQNRYFYFDQNSIDNFSENIVSFICNFVAMYHCKTSHIKPPLFAINCEKSVLLDLQYRLYTKGIKSNTGIIGLNFVPAEFYKDPIIKKNKSHVEEREFEIRLLSFIENPEALTLKKGTELFFISNEIPNAVDTSDTNIYLIGANNFYELEYIMHLRKTYE